MKISKCIRCLWVYDEFYETVGSYAYDSEEETKEAENAELAAIERGELVALGCIIEHRCDQCGEWHQTDSLWGIVIEPDWSKLDTFTRDNMDITSEVTTQS